MVEIKFLKIDQRKNISFKFRKFLEINFENLNMNKETKKEIINYIFKKE